MGKIIPVLISVVCAAGFLFLPGQLRAGSETCTMIQEGALSDANGQPLELGYDQYGYNFQSSTFKGTYEGADRITAPNATVSLRMNWNEAWLSNRDCDGDGLLDRHYGFESPVGSGGWLLNDMSGTYLANGTTCKWTYTLRIEAPADGATRTLTTWYDAEGAALGSAIWGAFIVVEANFHDSCGGTAAAVAPPPVCPGI